MMNHFENQFKYPKETITIPSNQIWAPKLDIFHFSGSSKSLDFSNENAKISHTGEVTVTFTAMIFAYCQIFGKYYPMDEHGCYLAFQYRKDYKLNVRQFTYSWATNRYGTVWNIIKHPCADAFRNATGLEFNQFPATQTFFMPTMDSLLHDTNCSGREAVVYPCADSYDGFDPKSMNLDISKSILNPVSFRLKPY